MVSCRFQVALGVALISIGHVLAFNTVDFANFPGAKFSKQEPATVKLEKKIQEIQEHIGTAAKSDNETKEEVVAVKSQVEELTNKFEGSNVETKEQLKEISDRLMKFEDSIATAETMKDSVDQVVQANKKGITELKTSMNEKITYLGTELGNMNKAMADTQKGLQQAQELIGQLASGSGSASDDGTASSSGKDCPSSFDFLNKTGQCLKVSDEDDKARGLSEGSSKCAQFHEQASLAILDTKEKQDGVKAYLANIGVKRSLLIGGSREGTKFKWIDGKQFGKTGWCPSEPRGGNCVSLWAGKGFCLDDTYCTSSMYLCEVVMAEDNGSRK